MEQGILSQIQVTVFTLIGLCNMAYKPKEENIIKLQIFLSTVKDGK